MGSSFFYSSFTRVHYNLLLQASRVQARDSMVFIYIKKKNTQNSFYTYGSAQRRLTLASPAEEPVTSPNSGAGSS